MKKRLRVGLALSAAIVLVAIVVLFVCQKPYLITQEQYDLIVVGMTQADLEKLLGGPPANVCNNRVIVWEPQADGKPISAEIPRGATTARLFHDTDDGLQVVWLDDTGLIAAYFGEDGRLQKKYFSTVHVMGPPSTIDWFRTRPKQVRRSLGF